METCGIIFPYNDLQDNNGCLKQDNHYDSHVFKNNDGKLIAWQDDGECNCGCWDEYENGTSDVCKVYREVKSISEEF